MRPDLAPLGSKRHANADLAPPLRDRVTQHAIGPNCRQQQCDTGKNPGQHRWRTARDQGVVNPRLHRADIIDRQLRIGGSHQFSQRIGKRFRALARARRDKDVPGVPIKEGQVNRTLSLRFRQLRLFHRADDTNNGEQFCVVRVVALKHALTERAAFGPVSPGEIFVHHADALCAMRVGRS